MKIIEKKIPLTHTLSRTLLSYLPHQRLAVFDIETTGLSAATSQVILIGMILIGADGLFCRQYFAESLLDEKSILDAFARDAANADIFFSYNGDSFDIPFLHKRCAQLHVAFSLSSKQSIDIYRVIRRTYFKNMLPDLRQKTVERLFAQDRSDEIGSAECVTLYKRYLRGQESEAAERKLLLHNYDDVRLLYEMLQIFARIDVHALMFDRGFFVTANFSDPAVPPVSGYICEIRMQSSFLSFRAYAPVFHACQDVFFPHLHCIADSADCCLVVSLPLEHEYGLSYVDLTPLGLCEACHTLPGFYSGFLTLSEGEALNHLTINALIKELFCKIVVDYAIL